MVRPSSLVISEIAIIKENNKAKQQKINECSTKMQQLQNKVDELEGEKAILESTYSVYLELKEHITSQLASLEETSVCITETKQKATEQIGSKIQGTLKNIEYLIERLKSEIEKATENYNTIYEQPKSYQSELTNELNHLQSLSTELEEAKIQEMSTM